MLDPSGFLTSLAQDAPPDGLSLPAQALWWDAKGNWDKAHECAQADSGPVAAAVHAYLHRKEPDLANAGYWYNRAGRTPASGSVDTEWHALVRELLPA